jgi:hypothetical protein
MIRKSSLISISLLLGLVSISSSASYGLGKTKYNRIQSFQDSSCLGQTQLTQCQDNNNQVWYIEPRLDGKGTWHALFNIGAQKCLAAVGDSVSLQTCNGSLDNQAWYPEANGDGTYNLFNKGAQKCLFRNRVSTCNAGRVEQRWVLLPWDKF